MTKFNLQNILFVTVFAGVPILLLLAFMHLKEHESPRYYGPVSKGANGEKIYHEVGQFELMDQTGSLINLDEVDGKVYVANFFFASCPTICPKMMSQMKRVSSAFADEANLHLLSFTVDPVRDSSAALKKYAEKYEVDHKYWNLLTGEKSEIYRLARNGFLVVANEGDGGPTDFIHSERLVLMDPQNHIRGYYNGTKPEEVDKLISDIKYLLDSKKNKL